MLSESAVRDIGVNFQFLKQFAGNKIIYGINIGFASMAQYKIGETNLLQLQHNFIKSHSSGSGKLLSPLLVKALMIARLKSLLKAFSGVLTNLVQLLVPLISHYITPAFMNTEAWEQVAIWCNWHIRHSCSLDKERLYTKMCSI